MYFNETTMAEPRILMKQQWLIHAFYFNETMAEPMAEPCILMKQQWLNHVF